LDTQFIHGSNSSLICKELAYMSTDRSIHGHYMFDKPYPEACLGWEQRKTNRWLHRHYHGLSWKQPGMPYSMLKGVLHQVLIDIQEVGFNTVYVKGAMKIRWLFHRFADCAALQSFLLPNDLDIKDLEECDSILSLKDLREEHTSEYADMQCDLHKGLYRSDDSKPYVCSYAHVQLLIKHTIGLLY
jgi:hypothetical protein